VGKSGESIFKKAASLFVEGDENKTPIDAEALLAQQTAQIESALQEKQPEPPKVTIDVGTVINIEDTYQENQLADKTKSIFKIQEVKNVLPENLPTEALKQSVQGVLGVSGLNVEDLLTDADTRITILDAALQKITDETNIIVSNSEESIEKLEEKINILKEAINNRKKLQEDSEAIVNTEKQNIQSIIDFLK
jgi:hypothetical protein